MNLYEISTEYKSLLDNLCDEETGEVNETSLVEMNKLEKSLDDKCIAITRYIQNIESDEEILDKYIKQLKERKNRLTKKIEHLKEYMVANMETTGIKNISCPYFSISICKNPPALDVFDEKEIPEEYKKIEIKIDTAKIKAILINGGCVPGAVLKQKNSIRIK